MARPIRTHERNFYEPTLRWKRGKAYIRFYDPNRSQKQKELALHVSEEDAAHALLTELTKAYFHGFLDPWNDPLQVSILLSEAIEIYLSQDHLRPSSRRVKRYRIGPFSRQFPSMLVIGITAENLSPFCFAPQLKTGTQLGYLYEFRQFFDFCIKRGWMEINPAQELLQDIPRSKKRSKRSIIEYLSPEQVQMILTAIDFDIELNPKRRGRVWLKDVILLAVSTGLRRGEICRLRHQDVDLYDPPRTSPNGNPLYGWIQVRHDGDDRTKTGDEDRVPLIPD